MSRVVTIALCGLALGACSGMPGFELPRGTPPATTVQFESEPAGAEAKTSSGQACRTPCAMAVPASEFTVTFTQPGFQPQTVPVRITASTDPMDPEIGEPPSPRVVPNPVYVELQPAPAARRRAAPPPRQQRPAARPAPSAAAPPPAPAPAPASPWPPVPSR